MMVVQKSICAIVMLRMIREQASPTIATSSGNAILRGEHLEGKRETYIK
jgi:hypothetical protein